jgi:gamma-glutamylcyclotransferase (GGCT)/AIG2-like uncharacterized protein YtfP
MSEHIFFYGTLRPDHAPAEIASVVRRLTPVGTGTVRARLYDFGEYPGIILDNQSGERVSGEVFALPGDPAALRSLDDYEEFHPKDPVGSLFRRMKTNVTLRNGSTQSCWVYVYNQKLPEAFEKVA